MTAAGRSSGGSPGRRPPDVVFVGSAARDIDESDPRGWRLGGGVTYGALACARLGIRTGALVGVDAPAAAAWELDLMLDAGVDLVRVAMPSGPVFHNHERPEGRIQTCIEPGTPLAVAATPDQWRAAPAWVMAPVAGELPEAWAVAPSADACVVLGWQGMLRVLVAGQQVGHLAPGPSRLLGRADIVGVSRHDIDADLRWDAVFSWLRPTAQVLLTAGPFGGLLLHRRPSGHLTGRRFPSVPARVELDATGAGDVSLASFVAARIAGGPDVARRGHDLELAALAGSLIVEGPGLDAVPTSSAIRRRLDSGWDP